MTRSTTKRHSPDTMKPLNTMSSGNTERTASDESASSLENIKTVVDPSSEKRLPEDNKLKTVSAALKGTSSNRRLQKSSSHRKLDDETRDSNEDKSKSSSSSSGSKESKKSSSKKKHNRRISIGEEWCEIVPEKAKSKHRRALTGPGGTVSSEKSSEKHSRRSGHRSSISRSSSCRELLGGRANSGGVDDKEKLSKSKGRGLSRALSSLDVGRGSDLSSKALTISKDLAVAKNEIERSSGGKVPSQTPSKLDQSASTGSINSTTSTKSDPPSSKPSRLLSRSSSARNSLRQIISQQEDHGRMKSSGPAKTEEEEEKRHNRSSRNNLRSFVDKPTSGNTEKSGESSAGIGTVTKEELNRSLLETQVPATGPMANEEKENQASMKLNDKQEQPSPASSRAVPDRRKSLMRTRSDRNSTRNLLEMQLSSRDLMAEEKAGVAKTESGPTHRRGLSRASLVQSGQREDQHARDDPVRSGNVGEPDRRKSLLRTRSDRNSMRDLMQAQSSARDLMAYNDVGNASATRFEEKCADAAPSMPTRSGRSSKTSNKDRSHSSKKVTC